MGKDRIRFGTDGWRGRIADDFTFAGVQRAAHGYAKYLLEVERAERPVVMGYDRRVASEHFAAAAAA
jgi:phosphomannomutase